MRLLYMGKDMTMIVKLLYGWSHESLERASIEPVCMTSELQKFSR